MPFLWNVMVPPMVACRLAPTSRARGTEQNEFAGPGALARHTFEDWCLEKVISGYSDSFKLKSKKSASKCSLPTLARGTTANARSSGKHKTQLFQNPTSLKSGLPSYFPVYIVYIEIVTGFSTLPHLDWSFARHRAQSLASKAIRAPSATIVSESFA